MFVFFFPKGFTIFIKKPDFNIDSLNAVNSSNFELCHYSNGSSTTSKMQCDSLKNGSYLSSIAYIPNLQYLVYTGQSFVGFGGVALYTIGVALIEEITLPRHSSYCQAIYYGLGMRSAVLIALFFVANFLFVKIVPFQSKVLSVAEWEC